MKKEKDNAFVSIGASLAGIYMVIVIMFLTLAKYQIDILVNIAWAFVVLGVFLGFFAYLSRKK